MPRPIASKVVELDLDPLITGPDRILEVDRRIRVATAERHPEPGPATPPLTQQFNFPEGR